MKRRHTRQVWGVDKLKDHPQQGAIFGDLGDEELRSLADDMARRGQQHPVEVLPDGTIVAGHQRVRAARLLGWAEVEVVVRDDLAGQGDAAVESEFIRDNLFRRQLSPLARARCIRRLMEVEAGGRSGRLREGQKERLKADIGEQLRMSPRNVNRYLLILDTPPAVQRAFDRGEIPLVSAGQVALLPRADQQEAARRIESGEGAKAVLGDLLGAGKDGAGDPAAALRHLVRALERDLPQLRGRAGAAPPKLSARGREVLRGAVTQLAELLKKGG